MAYQRKMKAPEQLFGFYLPGLEMARSILAQRFDEQLSVLDGEIEKIKRMAGIGGGSSRTHGEATRAKIAATQRKRWAEGKAQAKGAGGRPLSPAAKRRALAKMATKEQITAWAEKHGGVFDKAAFHQEHPGMSVVRIGAMVRYNELKRKGNQDGVFQLVRKEKAAAD